MKAVAITIKSKWCRLIERGDKTIEIRKNKALGKAIQKIIDKYGKCLIVVCESGTGGKIPFQFWCNKVEEISNYGFARSSEIMMKDILEKSCLTMEELNKYAPHKQYKENEYIYAVHISQLVFFYEPIKLNEFYCHYTANDMKNKLPIYKTTSNGVALKPLTKAPENFMYIEVE